MTVSKTHSAQIMRHRNVTHFALEFLQVCKVALELVDLGEERGGLALEGRVLDLLGEELLVDLLHLALVH